MADEQKLRDYLKKAVADLHDYRVRVQELEQRGSEPIAIVGMACQLPGGVTSPDELWQLVADERDAITPFPTDRGWPATGPDDMPRFGGFLDDIAGFDADFFGISPREAAAMDPQQRLLLESCWAALEDAYLDPHALRGSRTAVFAGAMYHQYGAAADVPDALLPFLGTGTAGSVISGRIAHLFGLEGPAVTVDTACSSSLVAVHLAVQALRSRDCDRALAGGVTALVSPEPIVDFALQNNIGSGARCKAFADGADGTGLSEGVGVVVLERLADALAAGHDVRAVIRGTAVNQDGASNGLTAPNGPAQRRVVAAALDNARVSAASVDLLEGHGTGTALGDPIEAQALLATYGREHDATRPLWLGSLKSNLGHAQAAAGVAGLIKVVQALRHEILPRSLHIDTPSSEVDWSAGAVSLLTAARPWVAGDGPRRAAVSSFGISGTNAHVVVEQAPPAAADEHPVVPALPSGSVPLVLSARSAPALRAQAERVLAALPADPAGAAQTLLSRASFEHRAVVESCDAVAGLRAVADGSSVAATGGPVAFVFTGQGAQWAGMGRDLYESAPVFTAAFDEVCAAVDPHLPQPLRQIVFAAPNSTGAALLDDTRFTQPALFALEVALFRLLREFVAAPRWLAGHSIGEIAAAHLAGVLSLDDAATLVCARAALMSDLPVGGAMLAVALTEDAARARLVDGVDVAAVNGARSVVLSGDDHAVDSLAETLRADGVRVKRLTVSHAFHSRRMQPMLEQFRAVVQSLTFAPATTPIVSTVTGALASADELADPEYWVRQVPATVRFADAVETLRTAGARTIVEIGPDAVLTAMAAEHDGLVTVATQRRDRGGVDALRDALTQLFVAGHDVDWSRTGPAARPVPLPTYPFQHERHWLAHQGAAPRRDGHPLLGQLITLADDDGAVLSGRVSLEAHPWLADHVVGGATLLPAAALLESATAAGAAVGTPQLSDFTLLAPIVLDDGPVDVQLRIGAPSDGARRIDVRTRVGAEPWVVAASGRLVAADDIPAAADDHAEDDIDVAAAYTALAEQGLSYGPAFAGLQSARRGDGVVLATVALPDGLSPDGFTIHPALLDAALQTAALQTAALLGGDSSGAVAVPFSFGATQLAAVGATELQVRATRRDDRYTLTLTTPDGAVAGTIGELSVRRLSAGAAAARALHTVTWRAARRGAPLREATVHRVVGGDDPEAAVRAALALVQARLTEDSPVPLVIVTSRAVSAAPDDEVRDLSAAAVRGLLGAAQAEHPGRFVTVDVDVELDDDALLALLPADEPQLAVRGGAVLVPRLARTDAPPADWAGSGSVLITGGTGALGAHVARHLVTRHGVPGVVLVSRRGPDAPGAADLAAELRALGARVAVVAADLTDAAAAAALLAEHDVTGVVHAAGVLADATVAELTPARVDTVLAAKIAGARALHEASLTHPLTHFVLFSSAAGVLGAAGQGNYAAANCWLDALAQQRHAAGLPASSIAWGLWESGGMAGADERDRLERGGVRPLTTEQGLALFDLAVGSGAALTVPIGLSLAGATADQVPPVVRDLVPAAAAVAKRAPRGRLAEAPVDQRPARALALVRAAVAEVLGHGTAEAIAADRPFTELGFTSLTAVELRNTLGASAGLSLPATLVFDYPTCAAVAALLVERAADEAPAAVAATARAGADDPIVIVGMACRYPGGVDSPEALWQLVAAGRDAIGPFPADRGWDLDNLFYPDPDHAGTSYVREAGFVDGAGEFDAGFFGISPREALAMDPQQRLLLESSWQAVESAGIDPHALRGGRVGVYAGCMYHDYATGLAAIPDGVEGFLGTGTSGSVIAGRVSYAFGFEGPAVTVDTACSSSLVAIHLAAQALRAGECDLALAGGVTIMATPTSFLEFSRQRGLAADGRCKAFGAGADGTSWGEGVGVLVVERLSDAQRLGHEVLAVVAGSAVNQDGASNGLTAPNGPSQQRVIRAALASAALTPADVDVVEAHGTGTALGDPIEAQAVLATYGQDRSTPLWLGSLKSNIGHTQAAAGVGGIIKMVQAMRHGIVPATLHADTPSDKIDWAEGAVELVTSAQPWPAVDRPRRAAVSSFGFSGTNAHVVLAAGPAAAPAAGDEVTPVVWPLSARNGKALRAQAQSLLDFLDAQPSESDDGVAAALARRSSFGARAVVCAADSGERRLALGRLAAGQDAAGVVTGAAAPARVAVVFSGQGSQRVGMGSGLASRFPVFADAFDQACSAFDGQLRSVIDGAAGDLGDTRFTQPALFAFEVALFRLLESYGLAPVALTGHSLGEITAAHLSGVLSLSDAAALITARASLMAALPAGGAMVAVSAPSPEAAQALQLPEGVCLGAVNSPTALVLSGDHDPVHALADQLKADGWRATTLAVSHAFHSHRIEPMLDAFAQMLRGLTWNTPEIPVVSNLTGQPLPDDTDWVAYWVEHARHAVAFRDSVATLATHYQPTCIVEVGPDTTLTHHIAATADVPTVATQSRKQDEVAALVTAASSLWTTGALASVPTPAATPIALPPYAFQRQHYWLHGAATGARSAGEAAFWTALAAADLDGLVGTLELDDHARTALAAVLPQLQRWHAAQQDDVVAVPDEVDESDVPLSAELAALDYEGRRAVLDEIVRSQCAIVLGFDGPSDVDADDDLLDLGFTSMTAVELRNRLEVVTALELPVTLVYECASAGEVTTFLCDELDLATEGAAA